MILVLIHSQTLEKSFNLNKNLLQANLKGLSLTSQRLIYDYLVPNNLTPESITISKELRDHVKLVKELRNYVRKACSRQRTDY